MSIRITLCFIFIVLIVGALLLAPPSALSQASEPMLGYAWSETIGWIDLNCANSDVCASNPFGLSVAPNGAVSGYVWSENIGWLSANSADLGGCPIAPCSATLTSTAFSGWLKALSGGSSQSGGWDGFIRLDGPNYGVTRSGNTLSGFAWGDIVVGWVDFTITTAPECVPTFSCVGNSVHDSCTDEDTPCPSSSTCDAGACIPPPTPVASIRVSPPWVPSGGRTQVIWTSSYVASCAVSENDPDINDTWTTSIGIQPSSQITQQTTYTLSCIGTDGSTVIKTAVVNVLPTFQEI